MTRILRNRGAAVPRDGDPPSRSPLELHRRLPGYTPSPLVDAPLLARSLGVARVWVKDESSRLGLPSFKILGASWGVLQALQEHTGGLPEWETLDELRDHLSAHLPLGLAAATDGNHGRAVARMARLLEISAVVYVPAGTAGPRIEAIESEGASCRIVEGTYDDAVERSSEEASDHCLVISDTSWPRYEDVPRWIIDGYSTIFWEIDDELERRGEGSPSVVVVQLGVGALGAAAARHYRRPQLGRPPLMVGVEPERAACVLASIEAGRIVHVPGPHDSIMAGLNCGRPSVVAWPAVSQGYDIFVAIEDDRTREAMRALAEAGIVSGETGAAGLGGLMALRSHPAADDAGIDESSTVLLLSTEGATDPEAYRRIVGRVDGSR
jgi:diaminopropionate ammonia-lyase